MFFFSVVLCSFSLIGGIPRVLSVWESNEVSQLRRWLWSFCFLGLTNTWNYTSVICFESSLLFCHFVMVLVCCWCLLLVWVYVSLVRDMCVLCMMVDGYAAWWSFWESATLECICYVLILSRYFTPVPVILLSYCMLFCHLVVVLVCCWCLLLVLVYVPVIMLSCVFLSFCGAFFVLGIINLSLV